MKQSIYFIPGLAASSKIFERIHLDHNLYDLNYLEWLEPKKNETLDEYIKRFVALIDKPNAILIGVSFGGIIAQEIAKRIPYQKLVIISSIKSKKEYSPRFLFFKKWKAYRVFPSKAIPLLLKWAEIVPKNSRLGKIIKMYNVYLTKRNPYYLDWCMKMALNWDNETPLPNTIHIQGTKDHIFPIEYITNDVIKIQNGTHAMILLKANEISRILEKKLRT